MFSRLCSRRSTIQLQPSTRHFSLKGPVSVKRPQANSVKTRLPPIDGFIVVPKIPVPMASVGCSLTRITSASISSAPLSSLVLHVSQDKSPLERNSNDFIPQELPQPSVDQELLSIADADAMQQDCHNELIYLVDLALIPAPSTPVVQFAAKLFEVVGYVGGDRIAFKWMDLPLVLCGKLKHVSPMSVLSICLRTKSFLLPRSTK
jgi:hypothetical protein